MNRKCVSRLHKFDLKHFSLFKQLSEILSWMWNVFMQNVRYSCRILITLEFSRQFFGKTQISNFIKICFSGSSVLPCGRTNMTKLLVAFRNFPNTSGNSNWLSSSTFLERTFTCFFMLHVTFLQATQCRKKSAVRHVGNEITRPLSWNVYEFTLSLSLSLCVIIKYSKSDPPPAGRLQSLQQLSLFVEHERLLVMQRSRKQMAASWFVESSITFEMWIWQVLLSETVFLLPNTEINIFQL